MFNEAEFKKSLGKNLRTRRDEVSFTQQELADVVGIAKSTIQRIEKGELNPTIIALLKIAKGLRVDLNDLLPKLA